MISFDADLQFSPSAKVGAIRPSASFSKVMATRRGNTVLSLLILLPVILVIAIATLTLSLVLKAEADVLAACRIAQADQQHLASRSAESLLRLNKRAWRLAQKRQRALLMMSNPKTLAAGASLLAKTEASQRRLAFIQNAHLTQGRRASLIAPDLAYSKMRQALPHSPRFPIHTRLKRWRPGEFAIEPVDPTLTAPIYRLGANFNLRQRSEVELELFLPQLKLELPGGLKWDLPPLSLGCSMTAERDSASRGSLRSQVPIQTPFDQGGQKWRVRPIEARLSSNS